MSRIHTFSIWDRKPVPQGSKRAVLRHGIIVMYEQNKRPLDSWRNAVKAEAVKAMHGEPPLPGVVSVAISFFYAYRKADLDARGQLKPSAPHYKASIPDIDKLARAVLDALTGVVFTDDARVVELACTKVYGLRTGCSISVEERSG